MKAVARLAVAGVVLLAGCAGAVPLPDGDTAAFGTQICGGTGADPSAYLRTMPVLPGAAPRLSAAGSSLIGPMMSVWAQQYAGQHGTRVAYQPIGSGSGIAQTIAGTVALGATDTPMTSLERAKAGGRRLRVACQFRDFDQVHAFRLFQWTGPEIVGLFGILMGQKPPHRFL